MTAPREIRVARSIVLASAMAALVGVACGGGQGANARSDAGGLSDGGGAPADSGGETGADDGSSRDAAGVSDAGASDANADAIVGDAAMTTSCSDDLGAWSPYACKLCMDSNCCASQSACAASSTCVALVACQEQCPSTDASCADACLTQFPAGVSDLGGVTDCLQTSCPAACEGAGG
jgi:hypothetical protein